ncbi:hypothetical protein C7212DRAFT_346848 [Tuber magnatum]|uniref:Uncharacterized protein n=1 Tax=Tuber magnatum TaxID=42249 RepID=A0A317SKF7_9PEZI|nr:hypothetical protein C7212DRAFT_346848 [Tuber magnatum]
MAHEIDPHHLVLMMHAKYGSRRRDGAPGRPDTKDQILEHGIGHDPDTNIQTKRILDAFSSLAVHKPKTQVVAFALQSDSAKKEIHLTIAENKNVPVGLDTYVKEIWEGLRKLSESYASSRPEGSDEDGRLLEAARRVPVGLPLEVEIYRTISQHTVAKQLKRVEARIVPLMKFMYEVFAYRGDTFPQDFDQNLYTFTDEEWEFIFRAGMAVRDEAAIVLTAGDHFGCERLAEEVNLSRERPEYASVEHPAEYPFPLWRTIEKLISQSGYLDNLFEFATSPHLSPALQSSLIVSMVPNQTCPAKLPGSREACESILIAEDLGDPADRREVAGKLAEYDTKTCPIHCECKLVQHFKTRQGNQVDVIPLFNYLAVSKLSGGACRIWLEAVNELGEQQFYTRGSHGAWYWPWGMPTAVYSF